MTAPTPVDSTLYEAPTVTKLHPIRGFFWGILAGIGLALVLIVTLVIELALAPILLCILVMAVLGIVWGTVGPKKAPVGMAPVVVEPTHTTPPPTSRFDDFTDTAPPATATATTPEAEPTAEQESEPGSEPGSEPEPTADDEPD